MTSDEQSVSAMMPMRTLGVSGASDAYTSPAQPRGNPASSRARPVCPVRARNARRVGCGMASCRFATGVTPTSSAMFSLPSVPASIWLNLFMREQGICQIAPRDVLKYLCPRVYRYSRVSLGRKRPQLSPTLFYTCARFLDETDKKVVCQQVQVEEG